MPNFWPGTTIVRSTNNAFTAMERSTGSHFATKQEASRVKATMSGQKSRATKLGGSTAALAHPVMGNLSERARKELGKSQASITIGTKADSDRRRGMAKAGI